MEGGEEERGPSSSRGKLKRGHVQEKESLSLSGKEKTPPYKGPEKRRRRGQNARHKKDRVRERGHDPGL